MDGLSEPCAHGEERAHAERLELGLVQHLDRDAELLEAEEAVRELDGAEDVGRLADQVAGEADPLGLGGERGEGGLGGGGVAHLER